MIFEVYEVIKEFLQNTNDKIEAKKRHQKRLDEQLDHKSVRPRANRQQKEEKRRRLQQQQEMEQQEKAQREMQQKHMMKEEAVAIGIEEEQHRRDQFLQNKSKQTPSASKRERQRDRTKKVKKSKGDRREKKSEYDKVTINKLLLLLVHLLKKFCAFNSSASSQYSKIFTTLIHEVFAVGVGGKYLAKLLSDELDFKQSFKSVFRSFMAKADVKDPIVNEFWCQTYALHSCYHTQSDQGLMAAIPNSQTYSSRYSTDYEEIEVLGSGGFGRV